MVDHPLRPATPQAMLHRLPEKSSSSLPLQPSKYIILLLAPTATAGKIQIAKSVSSTLSCPLFQGDSLHETCAKAAAVGTSKSKTVQGEREGEQGGVNKERYERMWLSKMTRTGLLFPEESRPAMGGFDGFAGKKVGSASTSSSRRGSGSSVEMDISSGSDAEGSIAGSFGSTFSRLGAVPKVGFVNKPVHSHSFEDGKKNEAGEGKALMVLTHPEIEKWCKESIRKTVGEYGIGVIFVPLYEEVLPVLDPRTMTSFGTFGGGFGGIGGGEGSGKGYLDREIVLRVDIEGNVEEIIEEIVQGAKEIMDG